MGVEFHTCYDLLAYFIRVGEGGEGSVLSETARELKLSSILKYFSFGVEDELSLWSVEVLCFRCSDFIKYKKTPKQYKIKKMLVSDNQS